SSSTPSSTHASCPERRLGPRKAYAVPRRPIARCNGCNANPLCRYCPSPDGPDSVWPRHKETRMPGLGRHLGWFFVALLGAFALAAVALGRGEAVSALWVVVAAVCVYLIAYRYYSL